MNSSCRIAVHLPKINGVANEKDAHFFAGWCGSGHSRYD